MQSWSFSAESYPDQDRYEAWRLTLSKFSVNVTRPTTKNFGFATAHAVESPLGILFAHISSGPQCLSYSDDPSVIWLALHCQGIASLHQTGETVSLKTGDIVYGTSGATAELRFATNFRQLLVRAPRTVIGGRVIGPLAARVGRIPDQSGLGRIFGQLLTSVANSLDTLDAEAIRPVEVALAEFFVAGLAADGDNDVPTCATATQTATLRRICRTIDERLADPALTAAEIAESAGISLRYLQKLFETAELSFGEYVRQRRLEHCRIDLMNPVYARESITSICFRWGFGDTAGFSRAFSDRFGQPPGKFRRKIAATISEDLRRQIARGWPRNSAERPPTNPTRVRLRPQPLRLLHATGLDAAFGAAATAGKPRRHYLPVSDKTVHWGYFSNALQPILEVNSGDVVTIETLTQHASDDHERMIKNDRGAESVFLWSPHRKNIDRRGAGPLDASIYGRGAGEGFGVHICTGPIAIKDAMPGDLIEVRILDLHTRPCANPIFSGKSFGSNAATWWGFHYRELLTEPRPREVVTIYEIDTGEFGDIAKAAYSFRWTPQTDPFGVIHNTINYPGIPVDHDTIEKRTGILKGVEVPIRPHFGVIGLAPRETTLVDSIPPSSFGGNIDNWRAGKGARIYLPVAVPGGLLSVGDPHASQGDSELCGTAIECSLTGDVQIVLHRRQDLGGSKLEDVNYPLLESPEEWVVHGFSHANYLAELGERAQSEIYEKSSLDLAMKDAFRKVRRFLMTAYRLSEDEAISLISVAVDFGVTQVVDGNWGVHGIIRKRLFADGRPPAVLR